MPETADSRYIGEFEENLETVFAEAQHASAVPPLDEAGLLFGKRCEVKAAHDRNADIEKAFPRQRMESCRGLAILMRNLRRNLEQAFPGHPRFPVQFPRSDAEAREKRRLPGTTVEWPAGSPADSAAQADA